MNNNSITPIHNWNLKNCRVAITDCDTKAWAEFIINNLTTNNKKVLSGMLPFLVKHYGWLSVEVAMQFGSVIEDRTKALMKAINSDLVTSKMYPSLSYQRERNVLGAAICELIAQGYESEFFNSISK